MLSKCIKHEFRATARVMLPIYIAVASLSVFFRLAQSMFTGGPWMLQTLATLTGVLFFLGIAGAAFGVIALTVVRFHNSFLGDEGYLTMTLPVNTHYLLSARLIVSVIWYAITVIVCAAAVLVALLNGDGWGTLFQGVAEMVRGIIDYLPEADPSEVWQVIRLLAVFFLDTVLGAAQTSLLLYAAMAVGHSFRRHKKGMSVLFAFVFYHAMQVITIWGIGWLIQWNPEGDMISVWQTLTDLTLVYLLALGTGFYFLTHHFLTKHLNLE